MIQSFKKEKDWFVKELEIDKDEMLSRAVDFQKLMQWSLPEHVVFQSISNPSTQYQCNPENAGNAIKQIFNRLSTAPNVDSMEELIEVIRGGRNEY